jgi:hypothetical protein
MNATQKYQALVVTAREQEAAAAKHQEAVRIFVGLRIQHLQHVGKVVGAKCYGRNSITLTDEDLMKHYWILYTVKAIELGTQDVTLTLTPSRFARTTGKEHQLKLPLATLSLSTWAWAKVVRKSIRERKETVRESAQAQELKKVADLQATLKATQKALARIKAAQTRNARKAEARAAYEAALNSTATES